MKDLLTVSLLMISSVDGCSVPSGYELMNGKYYRLHGTNKQKDAVQKCQEDGAKLVMIKNTQDYEAFKHYYFNKGNS